MLPTNEQVWHGRGHTVQRQVVQERAGVLQVAEHYSPAFQNRIFSLRFFHICSQLQNLIVLHQEKHSNQILPPRKTFKTNFTPKKNFQTKFYPQEKLSNQILPPRKTFKPHVTPRKQIMAKLFSWNFYPNLPIFTWLYPWHFLTLVIKMCQLYPFSGLSPTTDPNFRFSRKKGFGLRYIRHPSLFGFENIVIIIITITTIIIIIIIIIMLIIITEIKVVPPTCLPIWPPAGSQRDLPLRGWSY